MKKYRYNTLEQFIEKARKVHGNKYDYSKVEYVNNHTKVCIICPTHGEFWQIPSGHISGKGCCMCGKTYKKDTNSFIKSSKDIHRR